MSFLNLKRWKNYSKYGALGVYKTVKSFPQAVILQFYTLLWCVMSSFFTYVFTLIWAIWCYEYPETLPAKLFSDNSNFLSILTFVMTFTIVGVLQKNLTKHNRATERFNAFCGQCYDMAMVIHTMSKSADQKQYVEDFEELIELIALIPYMVKHIFRGDFTRKRMLKRCISTTCSDSISRIEMEDPFLTIMKLILQKMEHLKDQKKLSIAEWREMQLKMSTIYGPWGDLSTISSYQDPELIMSLLEFSLYIWYFFQIPQFTHEYGTFGILMTFVVVTFFNGFYCLSNHIRNPFLSSKKSPYLYNDKETTSGSVKLTYNAIMFLIQKKRNLKRFV